MKRHKRGVTKDKVLSYQGWQLTSSSAPGLSRSSSVASGFSFHISSSLLIWADVICRARSCSCSLGICQDVGALPRQRICGMQRDRGQTTLADPSSV